MLNYNKYAFSKRNKILKNNGFNTYQEFLNSDIWKKIQLKFKKAQKTTFHFRHCHGCNTTVGLQLHHMRYKAINLTRVSLNNLIPLCGQCHDRVHKISQSKNISFKVALRELWKELKNKVL